MTNPLLVIELQDEMSVPKVFYKGERIEKLHDVDFEWETETDVTMGRMDLDIEHIDTTDDKPIIRRTGISKS